jgi:UDP-N-acetylglucosamine 2-epimerase
MKVLTVVGARPQFVKAAAVSRVLRTAAREIMVHTGQHYDARMSQIFFDELNIPTPDYNLEVGSGHHGQQTGEMLQRLEPILEKEMPDWVMVYGDTNSTLAGALTASKLYIPVAHVEAGLRSFNRRMPEEINRVLTDHISDLLFCPSNVAVENLAKEGITNGVYEVGDVMADALQHAVKSAGESPEILARLKLSPKQYILATVHRAENTDNPERMAAILKAFASVEDIILFPVHPRTRKVLISQGLTVSPNVMMIEPVGYIEMAALEKNARMILTDSGGVQKEAYWLGIPCITLRDETEWVETVDSGWNQLTGVDQEKIVYMIKEFPIPAQHISLYGDGSASEKIVQMILKN